LLADGRLSEADLDNIFHECQVMIVVKKYVKEVVEALGSHDGGCIGDASVIVSDVLLANLKAYGRCS